MIDIIMEKYLGESKKKEALDKVIKVIKSCKTEDQINTAMNMAKAYSVKYPTFLEDFYNVREYYKDFISPKIWKIIKQKIEEIRLEQKRKN